MAKKIISIICGVCIVLLIFVVAFGRYYILFLNKNVIKNVNNAKFLNFKEGIAQIERDEKIGFINTDGKVIVKPKYAEGSRTFFSEGVVAVCQEDDEWALIDTKGKLVVPFGVYEGLGDCVDGRILVQKDNLLGYIDKNGDEVIPCKYTGADSFSDGVALVSDNNWISTKVIDVNENILFETSKYDVMWGFSEGRAQVKDKNTGLWGYVDKTGVEVIPCIYYKADAFSDGLAAVNGDGRWKYIDMAGNTVINANYGSAENFQNGVAMVQGIQYDQSGTYGDGVYDYINKSGESIVPDGYKPEIISPIEGAFASGLAPVEKIDKADKPYTYIDALGNFVLNQYVYAFEFDDGVARVVEDEDGPTEYIDTKGTVLFTVKENEDQTYDLIIGSPETK